MQLVGLLVILGKIILENKGEHSSVWAVPGLEKYHGKDIYLTEAITQEALSVLDTIVGKDHSFFTFHIMRYTFLLWLIADIIRSTKKEA